MVTSWVKRFLALSAILMLAGCLSPSRNDDQAFIEQAAYRHNGPPALTVYTMINSGSEYPEHTFLMINGSQRILLDASGNMSFRGIPQSNEVWYGITEDYRKAYESAHARRGIYVKAQRIEVSAAVAERALQLAIHGSPRGFAYCALAASTVISKLPGFEHIVVDRYPEKLMEQMAQIPGVQTRILREDDSPDKFVAQGKLEAEIFARLGKPYPPSAQ